MKIDLCSLARPSEETSRSMAVALGERLRDARFRKPYTLRELAAKCGLSIGYLSDIEHGNRWPNADVAKAIEEALR